MSTFNNLFFIECVLESRNPIFLTLLFTSSHLPEQSFNPAWAFCQLLVVAIRRNSVLLELASSHILILCKGYIIFIQFQCDSENSIILIVLNVVLKSMIDHYSHAALVSFGLPEQIKMQLPYYSVPLPFLFLRILSILLC